MDYLDYKLQNKAKHEYCWFRAKNNLIKNLLEFNFPKNSGNKILNVGCGTGSDLKILKQFGEITAMDFNEKVLNQIKEEGIKKIHVDIEKNELEKNYYDAICCFDVLEHIENDQKTLNKIYGSLKPGGILFLTVPAFKFLFSSHDIALNHKRRYSKKGISKKMETAGFKKIELFYWNFIFFLPIAILRIFKKIFFIKLFKNKNHVSEAKPLNKYLNQVIYYILNLENKKYFPRRFVPFGLTICVVAKK